MSGEEFDWSSFTFRQGWPRLFLISSYVHLYKIIGFGDLKHSRNRMRCISSLGLVVQLFVRLATDRCRKCDIIKKLLTTQKAHKIEVDRTKPNCFNMIEHDLIST